MTKVRKQRRKKKFRYVNKKRLNKRRLKGTSIKCSHLKEEWELKKSAIANMEEMGLVYDVNKAINVTSNEETRPQSAAVTKRKRNNVKPSKAQVVDLIERDAVESSKVSAFRLPNGQVKWLSYLITKYGEDYKSMARDPKNYYAETWKQIRAKIFTFKKIPEQYNELLKSQENTMDTTD